MGDRMPWLNDVIYRDEFADAFHGVHHGDNDLSNGLAASFEAGQGWDCCSGLGVPNGERLLELLEEHYGRS
jgi:kumamolisin